jgi:PAS domain S-box-containing protein
MRHKDGHPIPVEAALRRLEDGTLQVITRDITERKAAEERFRTMVEGAPNAMIMADGRGRIVLVNAQAERLFGYGREELAGQPVEILVPQAVRGGHAALRDGYQREPQLRSMGVGRDLHGVRKDGREIPVEIGLNPITTSEGRMVLASIIDITERRQAEAREREYMDELRHMSQQLLDAQETERRAIARELHDEVGQSLTATRLTLRDLEQQAAGGPLAPRLGDASNIVADLLAKVRQMSLDLHPSVLDDLGLAAALRWCVRTRAGNSGLDVQFELPPELPRFTGMAEITLFRVFQEALSNVLKHAGAKSVRVTLRHVDGSLELHLKDDGRGFDAEAARKHALSGKSLGMVGMEERVRLAGGKIRVESAPGRGTGIRVSLPVTARDAEGTTE